MHVGTLKSFRLSYSTVMPQMKGFFSPAMEIFWIQVVALAITCKASSEACSMPQYDDCEVIAGIAQCKSPIKVLPTDLPTCITQLRVVVDSKRQDPVMFDSSQLFPDKNMSQLTAVDIRVNRAHHEHFTVRFDIGRTFFHTMPQLAVFRVRTPGTIVFSTDAFQSSKQLRVLDFSRVGSMEANLDLNLFIGSIASMRDSPVTELLLKNVQTLTATERYPYASIVDLSRIVCPLLKTLRKLDLSHNDIQAVSLSTMDGCVFLLDVLDLRYNFITDGTSDNSISLIPLVYMMAGIKALYLDHRWTDKDATDNLWNDILDEKEDEEEEEEELLQGGISQLLPKDLAVYRPLVHDFLSWVDEMKEHCPSMAQNTNFFCLASILQNPDASNTCSLTKCLFPDGVGNCARSLVSIFGEQCNLHHCINNFILPVFSVEEIYSSHVYGRHSLYQSILAISIYNHPIASALCFARDNRVEVLDFSHSEAIYALNAADSKALEIPGKILGLHKLRIFNVHSISQPIHFIPTLVGNMPSLEEMHLGGNNLTAYDDQPLPAAYMHNKPHLKLVNLSHANLLDIEYSAFAENPSLQTLDLSSNRLTSETLLFQVADTNLSRIVFANNQLDSIGPEMCDQLDALRSLELDLGGNPLRCDCSTMEFVRWAHRAREHIKFFAPESYYCIHAVGGSTLFNVDLSAMSAKCETWRELVLIICLTVLSVVVVACIITGVRKRWLIRHYMFELQEKIQRRLCPYVEHTEEYEFDAFVLYSSELADRKWVHAQLVKTMEQTYSFKLCIHLRDFILGEDILENVELAISRSRNVIAVISPNFARSKWCVDELQMTRTVEMEGHKRKLIVILLEDFPTIPVNIPAVIRLMLENRTFLEWKIGEAAEKRFWKRLYTALYTQAQLRVEKPTSKLIV